MPAFHRREHGGIRRGSSIIGLPEIAFQGIFSAGAANCREIGSRLEHEDNHASGEKSVEGEAGGSMKAQWGSGRWRRCS